MFPFESAVPVKSLPGYVLTSGHVYSSGLSSLLPVYSILQFSSVISFPILYTFAILSPVFFIAHHFLFLLINASVVFPFSCTIFPLYGLSPLNVSVGLPLLKSPFSNSYVSFLSVFVRFPSLYFNSAAFAINPALSPHAVLSLFSITSNIFGTAIITISANITITASNSINVNPFFFIFTLLSYIISIS